jgi:aryl-alcohol dehydrogenase-like predicted oxidoreductase
MNRKRLGRSGFSVSELGFGARWLVKKGKSDDEFLAAREAFKAALNAGVTMVDTASGYGESEKVIGEVLKEMKVRVTLSSKCWASDETKIRASLEKSLRDLDVKSLDIYLIHNPEDTFIALPVFQKLKDEKLIRAIGVCGWHGDEDLMLRAIADGRADILQVALTLAHRGMMEKGVMLEALKRDLGIQVMGPLAKGVLSGPSPAIKALQEYGIRTLAQASLKFLIDHLPNGVPIPGTSKPDRIAEFVAAADLPVIEEKVWQKVIGEIGKIPALMELP